MLRYLSIRNNSPKIFGIFLLLLTSVVFFAACKNEKTLQKNLYPDFPLPAYKNAFNISENNNPKLLGKNIVYNLNLPFPPQELLDFYDDYFAKKDLKIIADDSLNKREWQIQNSIPKQYVARWKDKNEDIRVLLTLTYKNNKNNQNFLEIFCSIHPFVSSDKLDRFIEKNSGTPEWSKEFQLVTDKYRTKNNDIDLKKVLKDYPESELIKKLVTIEKDMSQEAQKKYDAFTKSILKSPDNQLNKGKDDNKPRAPYLFWDLKEITKLVIDVALVIALTTLPLILKRQYIHTTCVLIVVFIQLNLLYFGLRLVGRNSPLPSAKQTLQQQVKYEDGWHNGQIAIQKNVNAYLLPLTLYTLSLGILAISRPKTKQAKKS